MNTPKITGFPSSGYAALDKFWENNGRKLTELVTVGGHSPARYGTIIGSYNTDKNPYGRYGLEHDEYMAHTQMTLYLDGLLDGITCATSEAAADGLVAWIKARVTEERKRVWDEEVARVTASTTPAA